MNNNNLCEKWLKNPLINPETNRKIIKDGPKYKQFKKKCEKIEKIEKIDNDRIKSFRIVNSILSNINNKNSENNCIKCTKPDNCSIGDFVKIGELINSGTLSGVIYKTTINNINVVVKIVNDFSTSSKKVSNNDIYSEIRTLEFLTKYVIKTNFPHFPICYDVLKCNRKILDKYDNIPKEIIEIYNQNKKGNILMIFSELADNSLFKFYKYEINEDYNNKKILLNAFGQIFISLIFFHKIINSFHSDTHEGNFLYRKIKPGGFYHYNIFGKDYYIENLGYVWEIWDFGLTYAFNNSEIVNKKRINDIKEPLFSFKYKKPRNLIKYFSANAYSLNTIYEYHNITYNSYMIRMFPKIIETKYLYDFFNEFSSIDFMNSNISTNPLNISNVDNNVLKLMLKHNLIRDKINANDNLINKTPFII